MLIGDTQYFINDEELYKAIQELKQEKEELKEETSKLSEQWLKSQQENRELKDKIDKAIEHLNGCYEMSFYTKRLYLNADGIDDLYRILKGGTE
jgi:predicted  nucleic acid-binding Zn-ribbon protein